MGDSASIGGSGRDQTYERLIYECTVQRTELERRLEEMERRMERLKEENAVLKAQIKDLEKSKADTHSLQRLGPTGKPVVF